MWVLERLGDARARCLVDVGANVGEWTICAARSVPTATIYSLEPVPATADLLRENVADRPNVVVVEQALADAESERTLWYVPLEPGISSLVRHQRLHDAQRITVKVTTGDRFLAARGIGHVDLLKIDVEGAEDQVLRGSDSSLRAGVIDAVQFEYGPFNLTTKFLLRDFHHFFRERGYVVGKIYPRWVEFRPYSFADEDFRGPNYLAVRSSRTDLIRILGGGS